MGRPQGYPDLGPASLFLGNGGERPGEFEAVGVLLGLLAAHLRLLGQLLSARPEDGRPGGLCHRDPVSTWQSVVDGLEPRQDGESWGNDVCASMSGSKRAEWRELVRRVGPATDRVTLGDLRSFQRWGPRVARFSFALSPLAQADGGSGRRSATPAVL